MTRQQADLTNDMRTKIPLKISALDEISLCPTENAASWLCNAESSIDFLQRMAKDEEILLYACTPCVLVHGVLALHEQVTPPDEDDLQDQCIPMADAAWCIQKVWSSSDSHEMYLEDPLRSATSKSFAGGEKLIFKRRFEGVQTGDVQIELSQKLVHSLDLYFMSERSAYCRLDDRGDIVDVIRVLQRTDPDGDDRVEMVTILRSELEKYMALAGMCLVLRFDFTRVRWGSFGGWGNIGHYRHNKPDLYYHGGVDGQGSFAAGALVVRPSVTVADLVAAWQQEDDPTQKKYAIFKIEDRKNKGLAETSCAPDCISNYFQKNELPWEISPAYFRPEVLHRFKADPERYTLQDRSISCRNAWYLKGYDINEAGQVHAYIGDLAKLPYEEQLYWQAFNEWPRGEMSERAYSSDILGEWSREHDPLAQLKAKIQELDKRKPSWWNYRGDVLTDVVRYPATDSPKEWSDEVMALDQLLVEGFLVKPLRLIAAEMGLKVDSNLGTIKVIQAILASKLNDDQAAKGTVESLVTLHRLRTEIKGHSAVDKKRDAEFRARTEHGNFRQHFTALVGECSASLSSIVKLLELPPVAAPTSDQRC